LAHPQTAGHTAPRGPQTYPVRADDSNILRGRAYTVLHKVRRLYDGGKTSRQCGLLRLEPVAEELLGGIGRQRIQVANAECSLRLSSSIPRCSVALAKGSQASE